LKFEVSLFQFQASGHQPAFLTSSVMVLVYYRIQRDSSLRSE
jgi:hypothetical protein